MELVVLFPEDYKLHFVLKFHFAKKSKRHYSCFSASIGFSLEAFTAGIRPKTIPMTMENATAIMQAGALNTTGVPITLESICASAIPHNTPSTPPILVRTAASVRN